MKYEKYLPIGTVVMLKEGKKKLMITGFCPVPNEDTTKIFDYIGCLYPEGVISSDKNCLFNHEQIDNVYHLGYSDLEDKEFKNKLNEVISNLGKENN